MTQYSTSPSSVAIWEKINWNQINHRVSELNSSGSQWTDQKHLHTPVPWLIKENNQCQPDLFDCTHANQAREYCSYKQTVHKDVKVKQTWAMTHLQKSSIQVANVLHQDISVSRRFCSLRVCGKNYSVLSGQYCTFPYSHSQFGLCVSKDF